MRAGAVPFSSRRSTRSVSTLVLPVPAEASTQTDVPGLGGAALHRAGLLDGGGDRPAHSVSSPSRRPTIP